MSYGLAACGQAAKTHLQKLLILQKRVLRLAHAVSLFITSNILPINMLYVETVSSLIYDAYKISDLFTKYIRTRPGAPLQATFIYYLVKSSNLSLNQRSFARFGANLWNSYRDKF